VGWHIIKVNVMERRCGGMDWIPAPQNGDTPWTLVNMVMNLRGP
jgi:hypothetical protein